MPSQWSEMNHPMKPYVSRWLRILEVARNAKEERFGRWAREILKFYDGDSHNAMWDEATAGGVTGFLNKNGSGNGNLPTFKMTVNKPFEAVALFGPALFHKYPQVNVTPVRLPEIHPEALGIDTFTPEGIQQFQEHQYVEKIKENVRESHANIKAHYLNWLQIEGGKKKQTQHAITEAIVAGAGYLWIEMFSPKGSAIQYPRSTYISWQDILKDPDAEYAEDVEWIARKCIHPINRVEEKYGYPPGYLKGNLQSFKSQSTPQARRDQRSNKQHADSYDNLEYWEIYSKNGFGDRLKKTQGEKDSTIDFSSLGDYVYLAIAKDIPFPLNISPELFATPELDPEALFQAAQWPIPFWTDTGLGNGWPFVELTFYEKPKSVWPIPLIKPAIGELRFINWCMSFLADKVAQSSTTYVAVMKAAGASIQNQLSGGNSPFTHIELAEITGHKISDVISFLDAPSFSLDIWRMVAEVSESIDKRTGLTELIYGLTGTQIRSATEFEGRNENVAVRPDEMASRTEDWLSESCMKEMEAAVWMLEAKDVAGPLGEAGTKVWMEQIKTQDFDKVVRDFAYRIEAGSARKPNKNNKIRQLNEFGQTFGQTLSQMAISGQVGPFNAYMKAMAKAMDLDPDEFLIPPPPPPEEQGPSEEEVKLQVKQAEDKMDLQHTDETHAQDLEHSEETHKEDLGFLRSKNRLQLAVSNNGSSNQG